VQRDARRLALEADPHSRFTDWHTRTDVRYDAAAWRATGVLRARRRPRAGVADWLRATVDARDVLDREAQRAARQNELRRLDREIVRCRQQRERLRTQLRDAAGMQTRPAGGAADREDGAASGRPQRRRHDGPTTPPDIPASR
jgi:hypothetical protein